LETLYKNIYQEVIDRCRKGDRQAQFELYKLYYKPMYNICLRMAGNQVEAEDIMQEAFLNAFRNIESYAGKVSFGAWLKKIVVNRSLDYLKKKRIRFEEINERMAIPDEPVFMEMEENSLENIQTAIGELPEKYRVMINLILIEGYNHEEVSEMLGISNVASRTQFFRAKQKLKEILRQKEIFSVN
jgi:RNA polymerase sigma-70 factor (ECF subfamily)